MLTEVGAVNPRRMIITFMVIQVCTGLANGTTIGVGAMLAAELGGTRAGGMASTFITLGTAVLALPLAKAVAKKGRRTAMLLGLGLGALGAITAGSAAVIDSFPLVLVAFLLLGATGAINLQVRFAAADAATPATRGRVVSLVMWCTTIGAVLGPNLLGVGAKVGDHFGIGPYAGVFVLTVSALCVGMLVIAFGLHATPAARPVPVAVENAEKPVVLGDYPVALRAVWLIAASQFAMVGIMSMTPVHLQGHGAAISLIGLTISLHILGMFGFAPAFGWMVDHLGMPRTLQWAWGIYAACFAGLVAFGKNDAVVVVALVLLGLGWSASFVATTTMIQQGVPVNLRPRVQGRSDMIQSFAGATGGLLAGPIVAAWGIEAMALCAGLVVLTAVVRTTKIRPADQTI